MTITNGYTDLITLKESGALNLTGDTYDALLEYVIESASRQIDNLCRRFFYSVSQTRYYTPDNPSLLFVHDIASSSGITLSTDSNADGTYEQTWASTDYVLEPYDAVTDGLPYTMIRRAYNGSYAFLNLRKSVKIVATFGFPSVPKPVVTACILQSERVFKRFATPLGSESLSAFGTTTLQMPELDPDVERMLAPYRRLV